MLTLRIAFRYLFSKKTHNAVNIISAVSICGVAVATMAIVVVLSVFNGFTRLSQDQLSKIDPDLLIIPRDGKVIGNADSIAAHLMTMPYVSAASPMIKERAMLISAHGQMPVIMQAIGEEYSKVVDMDELMIDGVYVNRVDTNDAVQLSVGVANQTGLRPGLLSIADIYVPRRRGRINPANPAASFRKASLTVSGVMQTNQGDTDKDHVIVPLSTARRLLDYDKEASAIGVSLTDGTSIADALSKMCDLLGGNYKVQDRYMQQEESFRMIKIEKWVTFMMLVFILLIASFNIVSTLSLLVAEKRDDMATFRALGASKRFVRNIFICQGFLITVSGGVAGTAAGIILSLMQEHLGLIKLSGDPANLTIDVYPVAVELTDIIAVMSAVVVIAAVTSQITRLFTKRSLD